MNKFQVLLVALALLLIIGMYSLPKVVLNNEDTRETSFVDESIAGIVAAHSNAEIPEQLKSRIEFWKEKLFLNGKIQSNIASLDSLMVVFAQANKYDSAAHYAELYARSFNELSDWQKAGDAYFEAFTFALETQKIEVLGTNAENAYKKVLAKEPQNYDVRHNLAMIAISSASPMQGIMMLRKILEEKPNHQLSLMSMGRMSIQTGQYANGAQRFEAFVNYYPQHIEGNFFLGVCYYETNRLVKAKVQFQKMKELGADAQVLTAANEYLEKIKLKNQKK